MTSVVPFNIHITDEVLRKIRSKVAAYEWHEMPDDGGWGYGANLDYMKDLCAYWLDEYDWRKTEERLSRFSQFKANIDGSEIHFIHEKGSGPAPMPLILSHGWPGSVYEFQNIIEPLAHPERFGGSVEDAFDVIVPSLPGFGFSDAPPRPVGPRKIADIFGKLMNDVLGYEQYLAQGGDWGSSISSWLGAEHSDHCKGVHLNFMGLSNNEGPQTDEEKLWLKTIRKTMSEESAYLQLQSTKPQTLSYAMMDSPVGIAAWIIEKFHGWSDLKGGGLDDIYTRDDLLSNIMIYLVTGSFNTASWIYYGRRKEGTNPISPKPISISVPTAAALFPAEFMPWPPRSYVERTYNITRWTEMKSGGHFAAMEEPDLLVGDIRAFAKTLR